jgi:hypothetical protein
MGKQSGLGDNFYISGYDLSGDVSAISQLGGGPATLDVTGIKSYANELIPGLRQGDWQFTSFWEFTSGDGQGYALNALDSLPVADVVGMYFRGTALQNKAAAINGKQLNMDPTRDASGNLSLAVEVQGSGYGMEWGEMLTAGLRTDEAATAGPAITDTAATSYGAQAYVQLVAFTGTSVTIGIEHATTSGGTYNPLMATSAMTAIGAQRLSVSNTTAVDQYLKVTTAGTFSNAVFAVAFMRNPVAGVVF